MNEIEVTLPDGTSFSMEAGEFLEVKVTHQKLGPPDVLQAWKRPMNEHVAKFVFQGAHEREVTYLSIEETIKEIS